MVRVLGEHQANAAVMEEACWALKNLAVLDANPAAIAAAGGIETVVRVLGEHQANAKVMEPACGALFNIGFDEALQKRIKDAGAEPLVRAAVAAPGATDTTKELGQKLLDRLTVCVCVCIHACSTCFLCIRYTHTYINICMHACKCYVFGSESVTE